jgi:uncharacterized protein with HEPN domain
VREGIANVAEFLGAMTREKFQADKKTLHAVVRNLEVIGEAVKNVPSEVRDRHPEVPWQRIAGLRDILIHQYFGLDIDIIWDIIQNKLPDLRQQVETILSEPGEKPVP